MSDKKDIIETLEYLISEDCTDSQDDYYRDIETAIAMLKEQEAVVRCKDCKHRGNSGKCVLSAISEEKNFPLFMLDNRGDWFCADGERKEGR